MIESNTFILICQKNYQITQFENPVGKDGYLIVKGRKIRIKQCHIEEDAGKTIFCSSMSLLDYNRAGTPLIEIVTEPDLKNAEEAEFFAQEIRRIVRYLDISSAHMEKGSLRVDVNISTNYEGKGLGTKVEIKNLNSFKSIRKAIKFEKIRQTDLLKEGKKIAQETRKFNENLDKTFELRSKENAKDYRYFLDPDLPSYDVKYIIEKIKSEEKIELPAEKRKRFKDEYSLTEEQINFICDDKKISDYFDGCVQLGGDVKQLVSWMLSDVKKELNKRKIPIYDSPLTQKRLIDLLHFLNKNCINISTAKKVLEYIFTEDKDPKNIIKEKKLEEMDAKEIISLVKNVIDKNKKISYNIESKEDNQINFLIGKIMKLSSGKANALQVREKIIEILNLN